MGAVVQLWERLLSVLLAVPFSIIIGLMICFRLGSDWRIKPLRDIYERLYEKIKTKQSLRLTNYWFQQILLKIGTGNRLHLSRKVKAQLADLETSNIQTYLNKRVFTLLLVKCYLNSLTRLLAIIASPIEIMSPARKPNQPVDLFANRFRKNPVLNQKAMLEMVPLSLSKES